METTRRGHRPRVSREARLLVTTTILAAIALGALARIRYGAAAADQGRLPAMITSLVTSSDFERMAEKIEQATTRVRAGITVVDLVQTDVSHDDAPRARTQAVLRLHDDVGVTWIEGGWALATHDRVRLLARDAGSGLAVVRIEDGLQPAGAQPRPFDRPGRPRYLLATQTSSMGAILTPMFVGGLEPVDAALWGANAWATPSGFPCLPGAFVFTVEGDWVGLAALESRDVTLVPADVVLREAERLLQASQSARGTLGVRGQRPPSRVRRVRTMASPLPGSIRQVPQRAC